MNKEKFLKELRERLKQLPEEEIYKSVSYYSELISDMVEDGMTEEEAVKSFGDINDIAEKILQDAPIGTLVKTRIKPKSGWSVAAIILIALGAPLWLSLIIAALGLIVGVIAGIAGLALGFIALVAALGFAGIAMILKAFTFGGAYILFSLGAGILLIGLFLLGVLLTKYIVKFAVKAIKWVYRKVKACFIKKGEC